jgi:uncharacterized membrane protein YdjX (TVP38/TMEM64 family)
MLRACAKRRKCHPEKEKMISSKLYRYWIAPLVILAVFLALFFAARFANIPILVDPSPWINGGGLVAGSAGVLLLISDVILPVPSSLVMTAHGTLFGLWTGAVLSMIGAVGASLVGFALGRAGEKSIRRFVIPSEYERAEALIEEWGVLAVVVTRPVPLLAETVSIMAGASPLTWKRMLLASAAGSLPSALLYALAGSALASFQSGIWIFVIVLLMAGIFWGIGRKFDALR